MHDYNTAQALCEIERINFGLTLNVKNPDEKLKRQYFEAVQALQKAYHEFVLLNDLKDKLAQTEG